MSEDTIATSTNEVAGSYDDNPNVSQPISPPVENGAPQVPVDDKPWLMRDKFKGSSDVEVMQEQSKAYHELQSKMGKWWGAPKDADYDVSSLAEYSIEANDPILVGMKQTFKEMGLSNEAVKKLAASYDDSLKSMARGMEENLQKAMTPDLAAQAQRVDQYLGKFKKEEAETIKTWLQTPEDFKMFNTLIAMNPTPSNSVPSQGASYGHRYESSAEVEREKIANMQKYQKDQGYRNEVAQRYRDAKTRELKG